MLAAKLLKPSCAVANLHYQTHCSAAAPLKAATGRASQQGSEAQTSNKLSFKPSISMRPITTNVNVLLAGGYQYLGKTFKELKTEHGNKADDDNNGNAGNRNGAELASDSSAVRNAPRRVGKAETDDDNNAMQHKSSQSSSCATSTEQARRSHSQGEW
jgi:hypothetical protein